MKVCPLNTDESQMELRCQVKSQGLLGSQPPWQVCPSNLLPYERFYRER
jgi:hypothetical protein